MSDPNLGTVTGVEDANPRVSIVIPCRDSGETLGAQLAALEGQLENPTAEVVVADNGSTDDTRQVVEAFSKRGVKASLIDASRAPGINVARNVGVCASVGELILLCDADDLVSEGWVAAYWRAYETGARLVGGQLIHIDSGGNLLRREPTGLNTHLGYLPWPQGANCGFARSVYDEIGGFDERYKGGGDETDFFWRAQISGYELEFVSEASVRYTSRPSVISAWRQHASYGRSEVELFRAYGDTGMPRSSVCAALYFWLPLPVRLVYAVLRPSGRLKLVGRLARHSARVRTSLRLRTLYV